MTKILVVYDSRTGNTEKMALDPDKLLLITSRIDAIRDHIEKVRKSTRWKLRAAIGGRVRWYVLPEEKVGKR
jgi:ribosomal protein S15P/S13E